LLGALLRTINSEIINSEIFLDNWISPLFLFSPRCQTSRAHKRPLTQGNLLADLTSGRSLSFSSCFRSLLSKCSRCFLPEDLLFQVSLPSAPRSHLIEHLVQQGHQVEQNVGAGNPDQEKANLVLLIRRLDKVSETEEANVDEQHAAFIEEFQEIEHAAVEGLGERDHVEADQVDPHQHH